MATPSGRTPCERSHPRVSPYSGRAETGRSRQTSADETLPALAAVEETQASTEGSHPALASGRYLHQLLVQLIVKETVGQRDTSGNPLNTAVISGGSFSGILEKLWGLYGSRVKSRAVKTDGV
ncbi:hypothetical protein PPTG_17705 [Phytophthora nicotianae INRA-310]|uniref:Uncharacterized protein n=1 Tax=Phytophthora nicotianae (strain INRA-310) TaxID=761204 RepID=W2PLF9_PHYN3|nr:hypothetical protein PPTG_17705 [Phytophthora nicotianae INRA-310]ETN00855.1 hypothetical protein PPTG_17705 [Phytophthora nicotianae INRA-310]